MKKFNYNIPSKINNAGEAINSTLKYITSVYSGLSDSAFFELKVILYELVLNAIKHGNIEDETKNVNILAVVRRNKDVIIMVEDEGNGYKNGHGCITKHEDIYDDNYILNLQENGRGMLIVQNLCNRIWINQKGNKVAVLKSLSM